MAIKFYLDIGGKRYMLPVNPGELKVVVPSNNQTSEVVKLGEVTQFSPTGLQSVSFGSFFPLKQNSSFATPGSDWKAPHDYVALIKKAMDDQKAIRLIITDTKINMLASIDSFDWALVDSTGDVEYSISLKEYREYAAKYVKTVAKKVSVARKTPPAPRPVISQTITPGCTVIVNGRLHRDSYGSGPGQTEVNATRLVNFIAAGRSHPYHVTMLDGGWRGWVTAGSVRRIK